MGAGIAFAPLRYPTEFLDNAVVVRAHALIVGMRRSILVLDCSVAADGF